MATLQFPSIIPSSNAFGIRYSTQINTSGLSGSVQTLEIPGARWVCSMSFQDLDLDESRDLASFLVSLRGSSGRFYLKDFSYSGTRGTGAGTPVLSVLGQTGSSVTTTGWDVSSLVLRAGDYIQLDNFETKMVNKDITSDVAGAATITFDPPIRSTPSTTGITLLNCKSIMMLSDDEVRWSVDNAGLLADFTVNCTETFL